MSHFSWGTPDLQIPLDPVNYVLGHSLTLPKLLDWQVLAQPQSTLWTAAPWPVFCAAPTHAGAVPAPLKAHVGVAPNTQLTGSSGVWRSGVLQLMCECDARKIPRNIICDTICWIHTSSNYLSMDPLNLINTTKYFNKATWI